jgi:hypothetical protein
VVKNIKFKIILTVLIACLLGGWFYFFEKRLYQRPEVDLAKNFLSTNSAAIEIVGSVQGIDFKRGGSRVDGYGQNLNGRYYYVLKGNKEKKTFYVDWKTSNGNFEVERIGLVEGLSSKGIWPKNS